MNLRLSLYFLLAFSFTFSSVYAQDHPWEIRLGLGIESMESFTEGQREYYIDPITVGLGLDVGITDHLSLGLHHYFINSNNADYYDQVTTLYTNFEYTINHTVLKGRWYTDQWRFIQVYLSPGFHLLSYDYPEFGFKRNATGISAGAGIVLRIRRLRINLVDFNIVRLNQHIFTDTVSDRIYLTLKGGIAIRIIEPL